VGEVAAEESAKELAAALAGADMVFLTAGMGGGTGTGAISVAARIARSIGAVTVAVVTTPFSFEVGRRQNNARDGLAKLRPHTDTLITIPNDRLLSVAPRDLPLEMAFRMADDVLRQGIQGISELITEPGLINVDFAHIRNVMQSGGGSLMTIGIGQGDRKAKKAIEAALNHPLIDSFNLEHASGIIVNFTAGKDLSFAEVIEAMNELQEKTHNQAEIIPGIINDDRMGDRVQVIMIITGVGATPIDVPVRMQRQSISAVPAAQPARTEAAALQNPVGRSAPARVMEPALYETSSYQTDLDIPAFLRRRNR
jgi:cell division protein FtsZ